MEDEKRVELGDMKQSGENTSSLANDTTQVDKQFESKDSDTESSLKSDRSQSSKRKAWECAGIVEEKCHPNPNAKRDSLETMVPLKSISQPSFPKSDLQIRKAIPAQMRRLQTTLNPSSQILLRPPPPNLPPKPFHRIQPRPKQPFPSLKTLIPTNNSCTK